MMSYVPSDRHKHPCMGHLPTATLPMRLQFLMVVVLHSMAYLHSGAYAFSAPMKARSAIGSNNLLRSRENRYFKYTCNRNHHQPTGPVYSGLDSLGEYDDDGDSDLVSVTIKRTLPDATPYEARNAWIEYHWMKGGGLPISILSQGQHEPDGENDNASVIGATDGGEKETLDRTILPIFMKERVEYDKTLSDAKSLDLHYKVTEAGPFFSDLVSGSHSAVVTFDATPDEEPGCVMTWNVTFSTTRLASVYETVTQFTVGTAASTIQEASITPRLFSATTKIDGSSHAIDPVFAREECLDFVFARGGGLPLLPPIPYGDVVPEGGGSARQNLLRIPPLITESIIDTKTTDEMVEFTYRLNDPGWLTFPFLVHTHIGRVRFTSNASSDLIIDWDVEIRPYKIAAPAVEKLVETTVSTILRNLRVLLTQPDAVVTVKPPRGNADMLMGGTSFGTVGKETWLGGVLDAHLSDTRSTMEQTVSLFQPWGWGRSGNGDENDCVQFQWTDGHDITT